MSALHQDLGSTESAAAAQAELERRRRQQLSALCTVLDPLSELPPGELAQSSQLYDRAYQAWSGLGSITVSDRERRAITLEAVRHFGFSELREGQVETISTVLHDESILVVMPTGAGKSLCYQLPALMDSGATLVISPLIALMKDQVENLPVADRRRATFINSSLTDEQMDQRMQGVAEGRYKLVYAAPERLRHLAFLRALRDAGVSLFVVDEAHCVSLWGHDFRPDYLFLHAARAELGNPPALAMTATAPPRVRDEIIGYIGDPDDAQVDPAPGEEPDREQAGGRVRVLALDVFRDNLHLSALQFNNEDEKLAAVTSFAAATPGPGIVYVNSRRKCESLAYALRQAGVDAEAYHAGLDNRAEIQDRFMSGATRVIVATIAFGMGIDKADIRFIVHFHPARSLAAYYQEVGRAGRDGKPSQGILFYGNNDWSNLRRWAKADEYSVEFLAQVYTAVASQLGVTVDDAAFAAGPANTAAGAGVPAPESSSGPVDANRLQAVLDADETSVRVAVSMLERVGLLYRGFDIPETAEIERPSRAPQGQPPGKEFSRLVGGLNLRAGEKASFKLADIAAFMKWPLAGAESQLLELAREGALTVRFEHRHMLIHLAPAPADIRSRLQRLLDHNAAVGQRRIDDVIGYATTQGCRHGTISAHLGSRPIASCDVCDNCTGMRPNIPEPEILPELDLSDSELSAIIVDCLLSLPKAVGRHGLARVLVGALRAPVPAEESRHFGALRSLGQDAVVQSIDELLADGRLRQYDRNGYPLLSATLSGRTLAGSWQEAHPQPALDPEELAAPGSAQPSAAAENERRELDAATPEERRPNRRRAGPRSALYQAPDSHLVVAPAHRRTAAPAGLHDHGQRHDPSDSEKPAPPAWKSWPPSPASAPSAWSATDRCCSTSSACTRRTTATSRSSPRSAPSPASKRRAAPANRRVRPSRARHLPQVTGNPPAASGHRRMPPCPGRRRRPAARHIQGGAHDARATPGRGGFPQQRPHGADRDDRSKHTRRAAQRRRRRLTLTPHAAAFATPSAPRALSRSGCNCQHRGGSLSA